MSLLVNVMCFQTFFPLYIIGDPVLEIIVISDWFVLLLWEKNTSASKRIWVNIKLLTIFLFTRPV